MSGPRRYRLCERVLLQRDIRIPEDARIADALCRPSGEWAPDNHDQAVAYLSRNGILYELNVMGGVVLETLLRGEPLTPVLEMVSRALRIPYDRLAADARTFCQELCRLHIVKAAE